ncbi:unnamed protein product [Orchesella dallaii]|uniref:Protein kinase domain-containing protein n=1 Tax=Orchesella dallaii TaxID=48710 RepID=A0ABP1S7R9_9HEXA
MTREEVWFKVNDSRLFDNMMHACNRANKAYPYTVVGVSILRTKDRLQTSYEHSYNNIDLKEKLDTYRAKVHRNGLKFGYILQPAYADFKPNAGGNQADATKLFVQKADFVIYNEPYFGNQLQLKSAADFSHYFDNKRMRWQQVSEAIWRENANTEISIFDAFYESIEYIDKEQLENVVIFWETMNTFSKLYNITIFAGQAFNGHTHANHWNRFGGWWSLLDLTDLTNQFHFVDATIANDNDVFRGAPIQPITLNETLAEVICNFSPIHPPTLIQRVSETMVGVIGRTFRTIYFEFHEDFEDIKEFVEAFEESRYQSNLKLNSVFMVGVNTANELFFRRNLNSRHLSIETKVLSFVSTISICYTITYFPGDYRKNMTVLTDQLRLTRKLQNNNVALVGFVLALPCEEYLSKGVYEEEGQAIVSSDFVICSTTFSQFLDANALINKLDFQRLFVPYLNKLLAARHLFREFNPKVTVKFTVGWRTDRNLTDFLTFYDVINKWASNNDYPFVIKSAFDKLEENETSGWWKIVDYDNLDENASYVEKQMEYFKSESERNRGNIVVVTTEKTSGLLFPLVSTAGGLLLLCTLTIIILVIRLRRANSLLSYEEVENFIAGRRETVQNGSMLDLDGEESGLNCPYNQELEIAKENFNFGEAQLIGSGNFGRVYKMQVPGLDGEVAVKVPKLREGGREAVLSTLREIKILAYVGSHTNVVKVLGAYTKEIRRGTVYIVTELCSEGSLVSYLRTKTALHSLTNVMVGALTKTSYSGNETELKIQEESTSPICKYELLRFALEIADGMDFIASRKVVHADLAARNVLLDCDRRAKICDFGLSRKLYNYTEYVKKNREPLPWRWMAIETLKNMEFSTMSDVWSYGVTLWEIFSLGAVPYSRLTWNQEFEIELLGGMRLDQPIHASEEIYATMQSCWNVSPSCRPSFADLKTYFAGLRNEAYELFG